MNDGPRPPVFPPLIPMAGFLLGALLEWRVPLGRDLLNGHGAPFRLAGGALLVLGLAGLGWTLVTMRRARTPVNPAQAPTTLVEHGPFRWSRNPIYVSGSVAYAGLSLVLWEPWSLALLPVVLGITHVAVVVREEALLEQRFGDVYLRYKDRVRRWL